LSQQLSQHDGPAAPAGNLFDELPVGTILDVPPPPPPPVAVIVLTFPTVGRIDCWHLVEAQVETWQALYPGLDVVAEARQALAWVLASPDRRKTSKGMERYLVNWLNRSVDRGGQRSLGFAGSPKTAGNKAAMVEFLRRRGHAVDES
jgi:hypothetical protein